ncbi:MAG: hypothetical protein ACE5H1_02430 [Thermodesulfobacteriota bacterium]
MEKLEKSNIEKLKKAIKLLREICETTEKSNMFTIQIVRHEEELNTLMIYLEEHDPNSRSA